MEDVNGEGNTAIMAKSLYKEEMAKVQDKHEKQLNDLVIESRRNLDKLMFYDEKNKEFSAQIHSLNEEKLMLLKEHEIMKSKLRAYEIESTLSHGNATSSSASLFDKFRGQKFKMEDEEGELFDNTYLDEIKREPGRDFGRESLTLEEIQRRNSMLPPHLRSSYMPQLGTDDSKAKENMRLDDSMFSNHSDVRRGTAYKRPGPPTSSKNTGRFSLGGNDLRDDILREQNCVAGRPSLGSTKAAKKNTPGKLSRIFSSTKLKDEDKKNTVNSGTSRIKQLQKLYSTSTPCRTRHSSLPKFEITDFTLVSNCATSHTERLKRMSRSFLVNSKRLSQKMFWTADKKTCDSTPEYDKVHRDSTKLISEPKSVTKKRASLMKKKTLRNQTQKDKRFDAYNEMRCFSTIERAVDETYSMGNLKTFSAATYNIDQEETMYDTDRLNFQAEANHYNGLIDIVVENDDDSVDFEKLCNIKESDCPFYDKNGKNNLLSPPIEVKSQGPSFELGYANVSPQSIDSNFSSNSTTRMSSHCARICWNQQKIPMITTYKAEKKSFEDNDRSSVRSNNSTVSLITTIKSFQSNVTVGWQDLPPFIQYYILAVTTCLLAVLQHQFSR